MKSAVVIGLFGLLVAPFSQAYNESEVNKIKMQIVTLAKTFEGQGDPDFSKQNALEPLVQKLLTLSPQLPIEKRIDILAGAWRQVWGPYDYRNDNRGVDPELGTEEIYQVVSSEGYYYNVSYLYKNGDKNKKRIGLLRGEFSLIDNQSNDLKVQFTDYPGASSKPESLELWQLPDLAENGELPNKITIVPSFVVKLFFGGGNLREVYTDADLRITYGASAKNPQNVSLYIMTRVK